MSKSLKANAGPKIMQRMLKQNLRKAVIYKNKPRLAVRGNSQAIVSEGCKKICNKFVLQVYNQHQMSTSTPTINGQLFIVSYDAANKQDHNKKPLH